LQFDSYNEGVADPSFGPPGCKPFYSLCPVPSLKPGIDWEIEGPKLRNRIIAALDKTILLGLKHSIKPEPRRHVLRSGFI
jgi:phytoene desaturase